MQDVLMRRFKVQVDARIEPSRARAITFEEAGRDEHFDRDAVLARAAARLSASDEEAARALFADRAERRRILAPVAPLSAAAVVE
jgi:predicted nuclease of restriction endonuclease-like RecB superfamily